jgi:hypothetical protein
MLQGYSRPPRSASGCTPAARGWARERYRDAAMAASKRLFTSFQFTTFHQLAR